jgi:hypothetical protein
VIIRPATEQDWPLIYPIYAAIMAEGKTYPFPQAQSLDEARPWWMEESPGQTVVAVSDDVIVGSAKMGANRPGRGSHVATASFLVDPARPGAGRRLLGTCDLIVVDGEVPLDEELVVVGKEDSRADVLAGEGLNGGPGLPEAHRDELGPVAFDPPEQPGPAITRRALVALDSGPLHIGGIRGSILRPDRSPPDSRNHPGHLPASITPKRARPPCQYCESHGPELIQRPVVIWADRAVIARPPELLLPLLETGPNR